MEKIKFRESGLAGKLPPKTQPNQKGPTPKIQAHASRVNEAIKHAVTAKGPGGVSGGKGSVGNC